METSGSVKLLKHVEDKGFQIDIDFNPPCDGTCFYDSAGYQLGLNATIFFFNFEIFQPLTCYPRPSTYYPRKHRTCTKINSLTNTASKQSLQTYKNLGNLSCIFRMKLNKNGQKKLTTYIKLMIIQVLKDDRGQC